MKKLISLVLAFVLIFSLGATVFAYPDDFEDELSAQNFIAYYIYWIWSDFSDKIEDLKTWEYNSMLQLIDINDFMRSSYSELESLNENLFGDSTRLEPLAVSIEKSLAEIVEVLANSEDEEIIENTKDNKDSIINNFLSPSSSNSLNTSDVVELSGFLTDFKFVFDSSVLVPVSPFDIFQSDSQALLWFSESTALAIDPEYSGGGGGSTPEPDPDEPDPDEPDPDEPDPDEPDPDEPDPDEPDPDEPNPDEPDPDEPDPDEPNPDEPDPDEPDPDEPDPEPEITATPVINYNSDSFTVSASGSGVVLLYVNGSQVSNPYTFTQTSSSVTYSVTATAQESDKLISETASLSVTVPALEPEPEPILNLVPASTSTLGGSSIYNGTGYKNNYSFSRNSINGSLSESSKSGYCITGFINIKSGKTHKLYLKGATLNSNASVYYYTSSNSSRSYVYDNPAADSNGVYSFTIADNVVAVRVCSKSTGSSLVVTLDEYPIQTKASTFSLRNSNSVNSNEVVTNFYGSRNFLFDFLFGWGD